MGVAISEYFTGVAAKRLSEVEIKTTSNQHELNGISSLKEILGEDKKTFSGKFIYFNDASEKILDSDGLVTWYDARERHPTRSEYRLYYSANPVIEKTETGDLAIIARTKSDSILIIITPQGSSSEKQIMWLFGLEEVQNRVVVKDLTKEINDLGFAGKYILNALGFQDNNDSISRNLSELIFEKFQNKFPSTNIFSDFARATLSRHVSPLDEPDRALIAYISREEELFRILEKKIVEEKLRDGFGDNGDDVDDFIRFSLSVQNRRKSRAGYAFENHLIFIFKENNIRFSRKAKTERENEPDFLFPGIKEYHSPGYNSSLLTMLGVKTTAKDRWRQILSEADKIWPKHLITLEPAISKNQTDEMKARNIQLVLPAEISATYSKSQQAEIICLKDFIDLLLERQSVLPYD